MNRAYSVLTVKSVEEDQRIIRGMATTPTPDRMGDIVEPLGVSFKNPLPLLHQHDSRSPVGQVIFDRATADGVEFEAQLARVEEPPSLKDRIDTAWGEIKAGLIRGVSIGFRALEHEPIDRKSPRSGVRFLKSEVVELSLVTIPANADAQITLIKSIDTANRAGDSARRTADRNPAGDSARSQRSKAMNIAESITRYQGELTAKTEQRDALLGAANEEGRTLDEAEDDKYEDLAREIDSLVKHLDRLKTTESSKAATAKVVKPNVAEQKESSSWDSSRPFAVVRTPPELPPGIRFARYAKMKAVARLDGIDVERLTQRMYPDDTVLQGMITRAAVPAASSTNATYVGALINPLGFADFLEYLRPMTILGKFGNNGVPNLTRVPFRTPIIAQASGGAAWWVGEGKAKPLTKFDFARTTIDPFKVANIAVATMESIRDSSPSADTLIRNGLAAAVAARIDIDFIDPAKAAVAGQSPASITNGVTPIASEGTDAAAVKTDIKKMINQFVAANNPLSSGVFIAGSAIALELAMMDNPLGQPEFEGMSRSGGTLLGFPVIVSDYVPAKILVLVNAADIIVADEGGVDVSMSDQASLEMSDAPAHDSVTPTPSTALVSMWQTNSVAFRAERTISWARARLVSVSLLNDIDWGGTETP